MSWRLAGSLAELVGRSRKRRLEAAGFSANLSFLRMAACCCSGCEHGSRSLTIVRPITFLLPEPLLPAKWCSAGRGRGSVASSDKQETRGDKQYSAEAQRGASKHDPRC